jgi:hypothetical protein
MDRRFNEVVTSGQSTGHGKKEKGYRALCSDCGEYHTCKRKEFGEEKEKSFNDESWFYVPSGIGSDELKYVAQMRAWNCCNEGNTPLDGFPECPDAVTNYIKR